MSDDPFADLDAIDKAPGAPPAPAPKDPKATSEPTGETKVDHPIDPKPKPAAAVPTTDQFKTPKELRQAYEQKTTALAAKEKELTELQGRLTKLEEAGGATQRQEADLAARIAAKEAQVKQLETRLQVLGYEQSPEYEQLDKQFISAKSSAHRDMAQLLIEDAEGNSRAATANDFERIWNLPHAAFFKEVKAFGDAAPVLIQHRARLLDIMQKNHEQKQAWETGAEQRRQEQTTRETQEREFTSSTFNRLNKDALDRFPHYFAPDADDPEGNKLLEGGYKFLDHWFDKREEMTLQQKVIADSKVRHRAAAFPRMAARAKKFEARIKELETKLKEFEGSGDLSDTKRQAGGTPGAKDDSRWEDGFDKIPG